jgi:hypothetical protein
LGRRGRSALLTFDLDLTRECTEQDTSSDVEVGSDVSPNRITMQE